MLVREHLWTHSCRVMRKLQLRKGLILIGWISKQERIKNHLISIGTKDRKTGEDIVKERTPKGTDNGKRQRIFGEKTRKGNTMTRWLPTYGLKVTQCNVACDTGKGSVLRKTWKAKCDVARSMILAKRCCPQASTGWGAQLFVSPS